MRVPYPAGGSFARKLAHRRIPEPTWAMHLRPARMAGAAGINRLLIMLLRGDIPGGAVATDPFPVTLQEMHEMDEAEQRRFMEMAYPRPRRPTRTSRSSGTSPSPS